MSFRPNKTNCGKWCESWKDENSYSFVFKGNLDLWDTVATFSEWKLKSDVLHSCSGTTAYWMFSFHESFCTLLCLQVSYFEIYLDKIRDLLDGETFLITPVSKVKEPNSVWPTSTLLFQCQRPTWPSTRTETGFPTSRYAAHILCTTISVSQYQCHNHIRL